MEAREETQRRCKKKVEKGFMCHAKINLVWGSEALMIKSREDKLRGKNPFCENMQERRDKKQAM